MTEGLPGQVMHHPVNKTKTNKHLANLSLPSYTKVAIKENFQKCVFIKRFIRVHSFGTLLFRFIYFSSTWFFLLLYHLLCQLHLAKTLLSIVLSMHLEELSCIKRR